MNGTLSQREEIFCLEVFKGQSQSDAYRMAWKPKKAKPSTIHVNASKLMAKSKIRLRLEELRKPVVEVATADRMRWLKEIERCAFYDVRQLMTEDGKIKDFSQVGDDAMPMVAGMEVFEEFEGHGKDKERIGYTKKIKLVDRISALQLYGKATGYLQEQQKGVKSPLEEFGAAALLAIREELRQRIANKGLLTNGR